MLRANGIHAKILLKFNFTCQDDIFMLQKYFCKILINMKVWEKKLKSQKKVD
jgi:hypothetical protein